MENVAKDLLNVQMCSFLPKHNRNLSNEFRCFVNYPSRLLRSETALRDVTEAACQETLNSSKV